MLFAPCIVQYHFFATLVLVHMEHNSRDKSRVPSWSAVSSTPISKPPNPTRSPNAFVSRIKPSASRCRNERIRHLKAIFDSTPIVHCNIYLWLETTGVDPGLNFAGVRITTDDCETATFVSAVVLDMYELTPGAHPVPAG